MKKIEVKKDYLEINGKPAFIFGGDFSYGRVRRADWRDSLAKIRGAGMNTVAFYVPWLFHEPEEGKWDFSDNHDLATLLDIVNEFGLYAILRMGPFVHSEYRNGGLPQWLVDKLGNRVRTNDPEYLRLTGLFYRKVIEITRPRQVTTDGPVLLIQLENELGSAGCKGDDIARGSTDPRENIGHVLHYYRLAREGGLDVPVIDINHIPDKEKLMEPLCDSGGGYPVNCFSSDGELWPFSTDRWDAHTRPCITIETGAGMFVRYYDVPPYRNTNGFQGPLVEPEIVEAFVEQNIAEGANGVNVFVLFDGYNFHSSAESMLPQINMNYQAAVSCVGTLRKSYKALKRIGWFVRAFEQELLRSAPNPKWAKCVSCGIPFPGVAGGGDLFDGYEKAKELQAPSCRPVESLARTTRGLNLSESNFLFLRNARHHSSTWHRDIRVSVNSAGLACEVTQEYPKRVQMELPPGICKIMPFFVKLAEGYFLEYSTATLLDRRPFGTDQVQVILHATREETIETRLISANGATGRSRDFLMTNESPCCISLIGTPENRIKTAVLNDCVRCVLVDTELAGNVWDFGPLAMFTDLTVIESSEDRFTALTDSPSYYMEILTPRNGHLAEAEKQVYDSERGVLSISGNLELPVPDLHFTQEREGNHLVLSAPVAPSLLEGLENLIVEVTFDGSFGQAFLNGEPLSDHAFGRFLPWEIGLAGFLKAPGILRIVCENTRSAQLRLRPLVRRTFHMSWIS